VTTLCRAMLSPPPPPRLSGAARAAHRAKSTMKRSTCCRSPTSIATPLAPRFENRDWPNLADRLVIIGGGARGDVLACCYVARLDSARSPRLAERRQHATRRDISAQRKKVTG
jgi:hypothetical protein